MGTNTRRKAVLKNMRVNEISLVDEGDNPHAEVLILKRRDIVGVDTNILKQRFEEASAAAGELMELAAGAEGDEGVQRAATILEGMNMDIDGLNEKLGEIEANLEAVTKRAEDAETKVSELTAQVETVTKERDDALAAVEKAKEPVEGEGEDDVLKSLPEPVRKRLEAAEADAKEAREQVEKARDERELSERVAKARELGLVNADEMGGLLHRIAKGKATAEDADKIVDMLTIAKNVDKAGEKLFEAIGKATGGDAASNDAQAKLDEAIANIQKAKPSLTREQAYAEALDANPGLYDEVRKIRPVEA